MIFVNNHFEMDNHYIGTFEIDGRKFEGEIIHNIYSGVIKLSVSFVLNSFDEIRIKYSQNLRVIKGRLTNGKIVNLYNNMLIENSSYNVQYQKLVYSVKSMLWSFNELSDPKFNELKCELENGLQWSDLSGIEISKPIGFDFKRVNTKSFFLYNAKISFYTTIKSTLQRFPREETCEVTERLVISIESETKEDIDFFTNIRDKIISLISFSIKDNINIIKQSFLDYDEFNISVIPNEYKEHLFVDNNPVCEIYGICDLDYNLKLSELEDKGNDLPQKLEKLTPIFNLYVSLFKYPYMPEEMVFLNIIQALETFHSRFLYNNDTKEYIRSVKERFEDGTLQYKLLLSDKQPNHKHSHIVLFSRLNDLLIRGKNDIFVRFYKDDSDFVQRIVETRNYYTHYDEKKKNAALKGDKLLVSTRILSLLLEYCVCDILGVDISKRIAMDLNNLLSDEHD